jgi:hypothetical protein
MNTFQPFIWKIESVCGISVKHWLIVPFVNTTNLAEYVHPGDINEFSNNNNYTVFKYVDCDSNYIKVMDVKKNVYRVKAKCLELISNPLADFGESVIILNGSFSGKTGVIKYLSWHLKDKCFLYRIEVDKILKKRIYRDRDIALPADRY